MLKSDVIKHFGGVGAVAVRLDIKSAAVSQWGEIIPEKQAYRIERLTNGALTVDPANYQKKAA